MSRYLSSNPQRPRVTPTADNPYQVTTLPTTSTSNSHPHHHSNNGVYPKTCRDGSCTTNHRNQQCRDVGFDALLSDNDTFTDTNTYYDYYQDHGYHTSPKRERPSDCMFSDDSGSTKLPYYEYENISTRRHSRNSSSDRSFNKKAQQFYNRSNSTGNPPLVHKDLRRVYPNQESVCERLCPENQRYLNEPILTTSFARRTGPLSRISSERPLSSHSSGVTSAIIDGCGGRCQTFENVCYYFLQVAFTMGILIGASLCIAGALLRKSAARNLQVLVYIGALLFCVSVLLLGVQCSARKAARKRRKALRCAKRGAIPLETLPSRNVPLQQIPVQPQMTLQQQISLQQQIPLVDGGGNNIQRNLPVTFLPSSVQHQRSSEFGGGNSALDEQQGVPWWRRKELTSNF